MCVAPGNSLFRSSLAVLICSAVGCFADVNSWLKFTSGYWEEPQWSQGILPNSGHSVMITNAGWKAVQIAPSTVQNLPDGVNVYSITISSPVDSFNTLLLNYAGFDRPLTVNYSLQVGPGAALTMHSSALRIATPTGVGLSVGGEVNQNDGSQVTGNQADVGWIGPGVYNFNSGLVQLQHLWVGGPNNGIFHQNGGSNAPGILHLESGGRYLLREGDFNGTTYTAENSIFQQDGGRVHSHLEFHRGRYLLNGGVNYGGVRLSVYGNFRRGYATAIQNGGTNLGPVYLGGDVGDGSYTLSNGVVQTPSIAIGLFGVFHQVDGTVTTPATITVDGGFYDRGAVGSGYFILDSGVLSSPGIRLNTASFSQNGGSNLISGNLIVGPGTRSSSGRTDYSLTDGLLTTENTSVFGALIGGFFQSGGTHRVANQLSIFGSDSQWVPPGWKAYVLSNGNLIASNIVIHPRASLNQSGGTITQSGTLTLDSANLFAGPGTQQFGALRLAGTNDLTMPSNPCVLRFHDSSALAWDATPSLTINNWSGSHLGGGAQRIVFGSSASALTQQQLAKIFLRNPAGFAWGLHPAKILPSGEIVPDGLPPTGLNPSRVALRKLPDETVQITVTGDPGYNYGVLISPDLVNWSLWTNRVATHGTFSVVDPTRVDWWPWRRFYRAVLIR